MLFGQNKAVFVNQQTIEGWGGSRKKKSTFEMKRK
jgi:hypothetical protein